MDIILMVLGAGLSVVLGVLFSEPLQHALSPLVMTLAKSHEGINGTWLAIFEYPTESGSQEYSEVIQLRSFLGQIVGHIIPDDRNYQALRAEAHKKPLRVRGELRDGIFFTGIWMHPLNRHHYHGSFQVLVRMSGDCMEGIWLGYSDTKQKIEEGKWRWNRLTP